MTTPHLHASTGIGLWLVWLLIVAIAALYARAAALRPHWSPWRTAAFGAGAALLLVGFSTPVVGWAHADLRGHMAQHLLLGMFAPLLLVLGAPVTLLLASLPTRAARRVVRVLGHGALRFVTHPITTLALNVGGMVVLYATPLFAMSQREPWLHALVHYHFVAAGCLFSWAIAGPDPAPHRPSLRVRGLVLFVGIAIHSVLAKLMYVHGWPRGTHATLEEIRAAAQWMYYGGDLAEMLLLAALLALWWRRPRAYRGAGPRSMNQSRAWSRVDHAGITRALRSSGHRPMEPAHEPQPR
ncbi:cytochrome c oxidase assembly protein [Lysobacter korlensis]|uniref:Cytochrome c oxidase assembly protein n=1 Tax=Lysobacter korlensis TaxID=553636 RepID=A0ABV6RJJ4_9GAMM